MEKDRVLIIGAGSAGLLMAHSLKKLGISYTVFEQDAAIDARRRDWSFGVYWAQSRLGECLPEGVDEKTLREKAQVDDYVAQEDFILPTFNAETGELMKNLPTPCSIRLQRRRFLKLLSQGVDIRYGKRLEAIKTEGGVVTVSFEDGTTEEGSLLIGCDGAHSKVRSFLLGPEKAALRPLPLLTSAAVTTLPHDTALAIRKIHRRHMNAVHPSNGSSGWISIQECSDPEPSKWVFLMIQSWSDTNASDLQSPETKPDLSTKSAIVQDMRKRVGVWEEPFKSIWQSIPDNAPAWHTRLSDWVTEPWDNKSGTVTLAGDAAHSMTFHRGQGLNNAIDDVCTLLHALRDHYSPSNTDAPTPFAEALKVYEANVWERGKTAVLSNTKNSVMLHDGKNMAQSAAIRFGIMPRIVDDDGVRETVMKA
ncbi:FAD/NAD(P)-binding domain-containing protein [Dendrothele bispora CBS 962.96]|uniref:FAD/NAD(P)-binding domain-containing protein n=1 Tax=Dendrothele bispora (strain CBS 962.96) TaxID=1314807 RepID=A0A4S8M2Y9_DENBC|nr:FAD/NAD(P)-binding domain-containing protein [Dendrothele bispora CBS 962.96]